MIKLIQKGVYFRDGKLVRAKCVDKDAQKAEGIAIARECIEVIRPAIAGVQISAPFGNVNTALAVLDFMKSKKQKEKI